MSVHYKFKNTKDYDAIKFDGVYISTSELKTIIVQKKKMSHSELQVTNEETGQVYSDDQMIPKNTNVIISRLPFPGSNKRHRQMNNQQNNNNRPSSMPHVSAGGSGSSGGLGGISSGGTSIVGGREAIELVSSKNMTEEEKIKQVQSQSTRDFDPANYARGGRGGHYRGGLRKPMGRPGSGYTCRKCGIPGHFINDCKMNSMLKVKRSSGIPRDFLVKVDSKEKGALMTRSGEYAIPFLDREAYSNPKVEKAPFFEEDSSEQSVVKREREEVSDQQLALIDEETDLERQTKKAKLGFAVPNWKNITKSTQPEADRYAQYHMVEVRSKCEALVTARERRLLTMPMYTISTNVLCRHSKNGKDTYVPIEIGIYSYSIEKGELGRPYNVIIDSGAIPVGSVNQTRDHTEATHQITNPSKGRYPPEARKDYLNIYKELLKYTKGGERTVLVPDERDIDQVKGCLGWLYEKASFIDDSVAKISTWNILPMVEYVAAAYNFVVERMLHSDRPLFTIHYIIKLKLENSTWDYYEDFMCSYHRGLENQTKWCAKSCATRAIKAVEKTLNDLYEAYNRAVNQVPVGVIHK